MVIHIHYTAKKIILALQFLLFTLLAHWILYYQYSLSYPWAKNSGVEGPAGEQGGDPAARNTCHHLPDCGTVDLQCYQSITVWARGQAGGGGRESTGGGGGEEGDV